MLLIERNCEELWEKDSEQMRGRLPSTTFLIFFIGSAWTRLISSNLADRLATVFLAHMFPVSACLDDSRAYFLYLLPSFSQSLFYGWVVISQSLPEVEKSSFRDLPWVRLLNAHIGGIQIDGADGFAVRQI